MKKSKRLLSAFAAGALLLIKPGFETDAIGLAVLLVVLFWQKKKAAKAVAA